MTFLTCDLRRFDVNLKCPNGDIALGFSARLGPQPQTIVLNTMQNGAWGEEVHLPIGPLSMHTECDLAIRIKKAKFLIGLNGKLHGEFAHRMPREQIQQYDVSGGLDIASIRFPKRLSIGLGGVVRKPKKGGRDSEDDSVSTAATITRHARLLASQADGRS